MSEVGLPALFAALVWWFMTGAILFLDGLPRATFRWSFAAATVVLMGALFDLHASTPDTSTGGAYTAFTCAVLVWGWLEMSFLMGFVTGPRKSGCGPECGGGWAHFVHATEAILYNELATLAGGITVVALTWTGPNKVGLWTYLVLWTMRVSAKLNLFFGVPNNGEAFLPDHLKYLKSFFRNRRMNLLFPFSIAGSTIVAVQLSQRCLAALEPAKAVGLALVTSLLVLAILEHWFMVLPIRIERLWNWAFRRYPEPIVKPSSAV